MNTNEIIGEAVVRLDRELFPINKSTILEQLLLIIKESTRFSGTGLAATQAIELLLNSELPKNS